jgi:tetratricopeptide (TPR) repeat protein
MQKKAEIEYKKGIKFLDSKDFSNAEDCFKKAYDINPNISKYLSYYGLSIALADGNPRVGIELCNRAIKMDCLNSDFYFNLGKIYMKMKDRKNAILALKHGLKIDKDNPKIKEEYKNIGRRSKPAVSFLTRDHLINIYLGKLKTFLNEL